MKLQILKEGYIGSDKDATLSSQTLQEHVFTKSHGHIIFSIVFLIANSLIESIVKENL